MKVTTTINGTQLQPTPYQLVMRAVDALLRPSQLDLTIPLRDRILAFEEYAKAMPQIDIPVEEELIDGCYKRKVVFPEGFIGCGKIHVRPHMDIMTKGSMLIATEDGVKLITAPFEGVTEPFTRKFGMALEETEWISFNSTSARTVEQAAAELAVDTWDEAELLGQCEEIQHVSNCSGLDNVCGSERVLRLPVE